MDLLTSARFEKIGELLSTVYQTTERMRALNEQPLKKSAFLDLSQGDQERYDWAAALAGQLGFSNTDRKHDGFERECSDEIKKRLNIESSGVAIPLDVLTYRGPRPSYSVSASASAGLSFVDMLRNASYILRLGAQRLEDLRDDVAIPRQVSDPTMVWLAPGSTAPSLATRT